MKDTKKGRLDRHVHITVEDVELAKEHSVFALCDNVDKFSGWISPFNLCNRCGECNK